MSLSVGVRICLFVLPLCVFAPRALATFAVCQPGWDWASNSKQQNPCEVAGVLEAACRGLGVFELAPLPPGMNYVPPQKDTSALGCDCNTVMFSLYMACTACQNVTTTAWTSWTRFCLAVHVSEYPGVIPPDTAIPYWAFADYTIGDKLDPVLAKLASEGPNKLAAISVPSFSLIISSGASSQSSGLSPTDTSGHPPSPTIPVTTGPDPSPPILTSPSHTGSSRSPSTSKISTRIGQKTSSSTPKRPISTESSPSSSPTSTGLTSAPTGDGQQNSQGNKSPNTLAIIGSVIGGLVLLTVVSAGAWEVRRRLKASGETGMDRLDDSIHPIGAESGIQPSQMRLYDPSDPSTFPNQSSRGTGGADTIASTRGQYNGAAEL